MQKKIHLAKKHGENNMEKYQGKNFIEYTNMKGTYL
jgi:hypothetical protein